MLDLKSVTHEDFSACLNQRFTIDCETVGTVTVELVEVDSRGSFDVSVQSRRPFSILLVGRPEPALTQGLYRMHHRAARRDGAVLGAGRP